MPAIEKRGAPAISEAGQSAHYGPASLTLRDGGQPDTPLTPGLDEIPAADASPDVQFLSTRAVLMMAGSALGPSLRESPWEPDEARAFIEMLAASFAETRAGRPSLRAGTGRPPLFLGILAAAGPDHIRVEGGEMFSHLALLTIAAARRARLGDEGHGGLSAAAVANPVLRQLLREGMLDPDGDWSPAERRYADRLGQIGIWLNGEIEPEDEDSGDSEDNDTAAEEGLHPEAADAFARFLLDDVRFLCLHAGDEAMGEALHQGFVRSGKKAGAGFVKAAMAAGITGLAEAESAAMAFDHEIAGLRGLGSDQDLRALRAVLAARYAQISDGQPTEPVTADGAFHREPVAPRARKGTAFRLGSRLFGPGLLLHLQWAVRFSIARRHYRPGLEALFFIDRTPVDLDDRLLLAAIAPDRPGPENWTRIRIALAFMDGLAARLLWNGLRPDGTVRRRLSELCACARDATPSDLALRLAAELAGISPGFTGRSDAALGALRPAHVHGLMARLAAFAQYLLDGQDHYPALETRIGTKSFEIIDLAALLSQAGEQQIDGPPQALARLALAPKGFGRNWNDTAIADRPALLESLGPVATSMALRRSSAISAVNARLSPPLPAFRRFDAAEIDARNAALAALATRIWDPARMIAIAEGRL